MRPEEMRSRGLALAERMSSQVDTSERLELMRRAHRRTPLVRALAATAAALAIVLGIALLAGPESPEVVTPSTTVPASPESRSLPVEVFIVLRESFEERGGSCVGGGALTGIGEGSGATVRFGTEVVTLTLPAGVVVTGDDPRATFLLGDGQPACVFTLPDLGFDLADYEEVDLMIEDHEGIAMNLGPFGQRFIFALFEDPATEDTGQ